MKTHDVYSFGVVSASTLYSIRGAFPAPQGYAEIDEVRHMTGGEAANSSIVLARLGASVKLDGNRLGDDNAGQRTKALLESYGIDTSRLPLKPGQESVAEVVFAADGTRTIFGTYASLLENGDWNTAHEDDVTGAKVICLDPFFGQASSRVAQVGFDAGIPVVTVDCRHDDPLLRHTSAVVIAESFIRENYEGLSVTNLFRQYQRNTDGLTIFTFGDRAIWYARCGESVNKFQPYPIEAVDTSGGGDAFRAGIAYGFLRGWDDKTTIGFAAAVAAMVCSRFPGVLNAPNREQVRDFMQAHQQ